MAATLLTTIPALCLSSQLPDPEWSSSSEHVLVALYDTSEDSLFLHVTLTPHDGRVRLWELREAVERHMRSRDVSLITLEVWIAEAGDSETTTSATVNVVYCDKDVTGAAALWLDNRFLSTLDWKPLPPDGAAETLYFVERAAGADVTPAINVAYRGADGAVQHLTIAASEPLTADGAVQSVTFDMATVTARVAAVVEGSFTILAVTVRVGGRAMQYYREAPEANASFLFLNCFNVPEWARLTCSTVTKTKDERKVGYVARRRVLYNPSREVEHEVQTSALPQAVAEWIDQLVTSPCVWLADGTPAVITEGECAVSDDNGALNSVKFTWLRSDGRGSLQVSARASRIFTQAFTYQFT